MSNHNNSLNNHLSLNKFIFNTNKIYNYLIIGNNNHNNTLLAIDTFYKLKHLSNIAIFTNSIENANIYKLHFSNRYIFTNYNDNILQYFTDYIYKRQQTHIKNNFDYFKKSFLSDDQKICIIIDLDIISFTNLSNNNFKISTILSSSLMNSMCLGIIFIFIAPQLIIHPYILSNIDYILISNYYLDNNNNNNKQILKNIYHTILKYEEDACIFRTFHNFYNFFIKYIQYNKYLVINKNDTYPIKKHNLLYWNYMNYNCYIKHFIDNYNKITNKLKNDICPICLDSNHAYLYIFCQHCFTCYHKSCYDKLSLSPYKLCTICGDPRL